MALVPPAPASAYSAFLSGQSCENIPGSSLEYSAGPLRVKNPMILT